MGCFCKLNGCCCGCSLRTGTLILSWINIIGAILQILQILAGSESQQYSSNPNFNASMILGSVLSIGVGVCGLYAVNTKKPGYLLPYIILGTIEVVILLVYALIVILMISIVDMGEYNQYRNLSTGLALVICFVLALIAGLGWYFVSVVHSYYLQLKQEIASGRAFSA